MLFDNKPTCPIQHLLDNDLEEELKFPEVVLASPTSGFFGKWEGLSDDEKIELNALASEHFQRIDEENREFAARYSSGYLLDWVTLYA